MNSIPYVSALLEDLKKHGAGKEEIIRKVSRCTIGWPYVFGAWGEECTPAKRRRRKRDDHPTIVSACQVLNGKKTSCAGCKWHLPVRMYDCRGFVHWVLELVGITIKGQGCNSQYNNQDNWEIRGPISQMPRDKICCIFTGTSAKKNHVGVYLGDGTAIECSNNVQWTNKVTGKWTFYAIPKGLYESETRSAPSMVVTPHCGDHSLSGDLSSDEESRHWRSSELRPTLRLGAKGEAVRKMQQMLLAAGEVLPKYGADGSFGAETLSAVRSFQRKWGLIVDGICGPKTYGKLDEIIGGAKS